MISIEQEKKSTPARRKNLRSVKETHGYPVGVTNL
jgi:hypothetical protein